MSGAVAPAVPAPSRPAATAGLLADWSIEATRPSAAEIAALAEIAPPGTRVHLSAVPRDTPEDQRAAAAALARAGLVPVPHLAARALGSVAEAEARIGALAGEAGVRRLFVIGGDTDRPAGPFGSARSLIERVDFARLGIAEAGVAAYPEGHPQIPDLVLDAELRAKLGALRGAGVAPFVVTQFGFDARPVAAWIARLRRTGEAVPVRIGLAGPTDVARLARFALRCGVVASARGVAGRLDAAVRLARNGDPGRLVSALAGADFGPEPGALQIHLFAFGGLARTARWSAALAAEPAMIARPAGGQSPG